MGYLPFLLEVVQLIVGLPKAKEYLRIDTNAEDDIVRKLLRAAEQICMDVARMNEEESTTLQNDDRQWLAMDEFGVARERVFVDKQSGKDFDRPAYQNLLGRLSMGDTLVVKSLDRLGRKYDRRFPRQRQHDDWEFPVSHSTSGHTSRLLKTDGISTRRIYAGEFWS